MSDIDKDLQQRLQRFAEGISPEPGRSALVVRSARRKRRLVVLSAGLAVVLAIGGLAGAATLLGNRDGITPAPGREETAACEQPEFDIGVLVAQDATAADIATLGEQLQADPRVVTLEFVPGDPVTRPPGRFGPIRPYSESDRYEVTLAPGVHARTEMFEGLAHSVGAYVPDRECPPSEPRQQLARYVFDVTEGNASATGILDVDAAAAKLCLTLARNNITASHLLFMDPDRPDDQGRIVFTFLDRSDADEGLNLPMSRQCFRGEELGDLSNQLQLLVDQPERFAIDFHRGPNDEPGLIAELVPVADDDVESFAAALFEDDELADAVPTEAGFSLREIIRHGPNETNHDYATVGVQMEGPVSYARVIFFVHPRARAASEMAEKRTASAKEQWRTLREMGEHAFAPTVVPNALPGTTCAALYDQLLSCHASLGRVMVLTQSTAGAGDAEISDAELEAATTLIRSFGSYLERIYPKERRFGDADRFIGLLEDSVEAQGGTIRLQVIPESIGRGRIAEIVLINETESLVFYGHYYELEKQALRGWTHVRSPDTCVFTQESLSVAPGEDVRHPIGRYSNGCNILPLRRGSYRVTKDIELESGDRLPLTVTFSIAPAAGESVVRELVRDFMKLRVAGAGAEEFLDRQGHAEFGPAGDLAPLYPDPPLQDFQIEFIDDVGKDTYEVGVSLVFQQGSYGETLYVRERNGQLVISGGRPGLEGP